MELILLFDAKPKFLLYYRANNKIISFSFARYFSQTIN